ncbi:hypothetical protein [Yinghuangia seranimata]|uniref:hypothetical protein n=1 Tax=Yinghuangia seranimata TaxID=408067 RepID=UPI00248B50D2|nr:hypothetical protein [Yinghuangia seranimata]MDI2132739.1 hypothetical protein [Yinghuangia seranimata]
MDYTRRDGCPHWCRGHVAWQTGPTERLHHDASGVTVRVPISVPEGTERTAVWASKGPDTDLKIIISRCVPIPGSNPWRVDLSVHQARQLAGLADVFAPGLADALRKVVGVVTSGRPPKTR